MGGTDIKHAPIINMTARKEKKKENSKDEQRKRFLRYVIAIKTAVLIIIFTLLTIAVIKMKNALQ